MSGYDSWKAREPDEKREPEPEPMPPEVNVYELAERILSYFEHYKLATIAPIICELEKALDAEYQRGVAEALNNSQV